MVVGTGLAGLMAAITAREKGLEVLAVCKPGIVGSVNCTTVSKAAFRGSASDHGQEKHYQLTMKAGEELNEPNLVEVLTKEAKKVHNLNNKGVAIKESSMGYYCPGKMGIEGAAIVKPLVNYARKIGVKFLAKVMIWELIKEDDNAVGAWGLDLNNGNLIHIFAHSIILASGGAGGIYSKTDNPLSIKGDGYALAYRAGAPLADMEFVQFYPVSNANPDLPNHFIDPMPVDVGAILNSKGEDVVSKYGIKERPLAVQARDSLSRAISMESKAGLGPIVLDLTKCGDEEWQKGASLFGGSKSKDLKNFMQKYFNTDNKPLPILPTSHFFMGGVPIDSFGNTVINGLAAAGEVSTGVHGANRIGGNALTETVVFGIRAGEQAIKSIKNNVQKRLYTHLERDDRKKELQSVLAGQKGNIENVKEAHKKIRNIMWERAGVLRNEADLLKGLKDISYFSEDCQYEIDYNNPQQVLAGMELRNFVLVAEAVLRSALTRTESRGSHYREDYPKKNDEAWRKHIIIQKGTLGMEVKYSDVGNISNPYK